MDAEVAEFLERKLERMLNIAVVQALKDAQERGQCTMILSGSPEFLVRPIAQKLGVSYAMGTSYSLDSQGNFIAVKQTMDGSAKRLFVQEFIEESQTIFREGIDVYSDSFHDLPLFEIATTPIAVGPDSKLLRICRERNWKIL